MSVKERLIKFAKSQERSVRAFEIKCGLTVGYINAIRVSIQPDKVQSIVLHYPNLNTGWLLTGDGKMLKSEEYNKLPPIEKNRLIEIGAEVFEKKLNELFKSGIIVTASVVAEKEAKINELYREIGRLESKIEELEKKKSDAQEEDHAECAVAK